MLLLLFCCFLVLYTVYGQIPCDDAYGQHCPEASGLEVGDCLKKLDQSTLPKACLDYINFHDVCKDDLEKNCNGKEYTGDALVCLSEWTKPEELTSDCLNAFPKKETKEKVLSAEEKKKAAQRRKIRNKAAKLAREL